MPNLMHRFFGHVYWREWQCTQSFRMPCSLQGQLCGKVGTHVVLLSGWASCTPRAAATWSRKPSGLSLAVCGCSAVSPYRIFQSLMRLYPADVCIPCMQSTMDQWSTERYQEPLANVFQDPANYSSQLSALSFLPFCLVLPAQLRKSYHCSPTLLPSTRSYGAHVQNAHLCCSLSSHPLAAIPSNSAFRLCYLPKPFQMVLLLYVPSSASLITQ